MNKKEIIILAAIGAGVYILSQVKAMKTYIAPQYAKTAAEKAAAQKRIGHPITWPAYIAAARKAAAQKKVRQEAAQKVGKIIGKKVAQKVAQKKADISKMPIQQLRYLIAHAATQKKTGKEEAALKAEVARREAAYSATLRKQTAQKIGKIIGKKVAQKVAQKTTPTTPSNRRKSRLEALYGSTWHDIWLKRQKR